MAIGSLASPASGAGTVTIIVSGVRPSGKVFGQIFADAASFKARTKPVLKFAIDPAASGRVQTTVTLPPGRYVSALFQDTKGTGKLETNFLGVPAVPYGFSNNARGTMGPPGFDAAAFDVRDSAITLDIELR
jgi:uncharacterized protein (DUF2141 family)